MRCMESLDSFKKTAKYLLFQTLLPLQSTCTSQTVNIVTLSSPTRFIAAWCYVKQHHVSIWLFLVCPYGATVNDAMFFLSFWCLKLLSPLVKVYHLFIYLYILFLALISIIIFSF